MSTRSPYRLGRAERLKHRTQIDLLFSEGRSVTVGALRLVYRLDPSSSDSALKAGFSVSKRHFKRSVDRNRIKRLLREAYRLQKGFLQEKPRTGTLQFFLIYTGKEMPLYANIETWVLKALQKMNGYV
jgi:ribonuclease P protein component